MENEFEYDSMEESDPDALPTEPFPANGESETEDAGSPPMSSADSPKPQIGNPEIEAERERKRLERLEAESRLQRVRTLEDRIKALEDRLEELGV